MGTSQCLIRFCLLLKIMQLLDVEYDRIFGGSQKFVAQKNKTKLKISTFIICFQMKLLFIMIVAPNTRRPGSTCQHGKMIIKCTECYCIQIFNGNTNLRVKVGYNCVPGQKLRFATFLYFIYSFSYISSCSGGL